MEHGGHLAFCASNFVDVVSSKSSTLWLMRKPLQLVAVFPIAPSITAGTLRVLAGANLARK